MSRRKTWIRGVVTLAAVALVAGALMAAPVGAAKKGITKAKAKQVATKVFNKNIATAPFLRTGSILVQAHQNAADEDVTTDTQINTLAITAPATGFLIITGSAEITNDDAGSGFACLRPRVDGANVVSGPFLNATDSKGEAGCTGEDDPANDAPSQNIAYQVVHPVAAGAHNVTQDVIFFPGGDVDVYEAQLVALFVPTGGVNTVPAQFPRTARGV